MEKTTKRGIKRFSVNIELMREKMKEKELSNETPKCNQSYLSRLSATLEGAKGNCSVINKKSSLWVYGLLGPYLLGFILITILCFALVDISLDSYFNILAENFSLIGLWSIGYFLLSLCVLIYILSVSAANKYL